VKVSAGSIKYTSFIPLGPFEYLKMPFGLCNAPSYFQRCINTIFDDLLRTASVSSTPSFVAHSGVKDIVRNIQDTTPYKIFNLLFTDELIEHIVFQTNLYASQKEKKITHKFCGDKSFFGTKFTYGDKAVTCL
jgi:hypothetical protein